MEQNLYIQVLRELEKSGIGIKADISNVFNTDNPIVEKTLDSLMLNKRNIAIETLLKYMENEGHISSPVLKVLEHEDKIKRLIMPVSVHATLTINGFTQLMEYNHNQAQTNFISDQKIFLRITCLISLIALVVSFKGCYSENELTNLKTRLHNIERQIYHPELRAK